MLIKNSNRRYFIKLSGVTVASTAALLFSGLTLREDAWATSPDKIDKHTKKSLSQLSRILYPHQTIPDKYYDACIDTLDNKISDNKSLLKLLANGVVTLDSAFNIPFTELSAEQQLNAVEKIQGTPFFNTIRSHVVFSLYNNPEVWPLFGYQGPSFPFGGYLDRGFNDISWLPTN